MKNHFDAYVLCNCRQKIIYCIIPTRIKDITLYIIELTVFIRSVDSTKFMKDNLFIIPSTFKYA